MQNIYSIINIDKIVKMSNEYLLIILILLVNISFVALYYYNLEKKKRNTIKNTNPKILTLNKDDNKTCRIKNCSSIDPVSDPKYNMHQIIKQSILLEEHLANKNKRCRDCIIKHFSHIIGLSEEAVMLACSDIINYPLMNECPDYYNNLLKKWTENNNTSLEICKDLRTMRKKLTAIYFFNEDYKIETK